MTARDMLNLLRVRGSLLTGLTAESYTAMLELIAARGSISIESLLAMSADDIVTLTGQCSESIGSLVTSDALLKKAFGE